MSLLKVSELCIDYVNDQKVAVRALRGVSLEVSPGETLGILGESGCGKSTFVSSLMRMLPSEARVVSGAIQFENVDVLSADRASLRMIRGARMSLIPQHPGPALNPVMRIGDQIDEVLKAHRRGVRNERRRETQRLLARVMLGDSERQTYEVYPHQLSGGQQQRVVIAQAIACAPVLLIADEPTSALDTETEQEILGLLAELKAELGLALILVTHKPALLQKHADRVVVMYAGRIVEQGPAQEVLHAPQHPYTRALLQCRLSALARQEGRKTQLPVIAGNAFDPRAHVAGCSFAPACSERKQDCEVRPPKLLETKADRKVECFLYEN